MLTENEKDSFTPTQILHDFEKATLNAYISCFLGVIISGCYFHFTQNLWKQMQKKNYLKIILKISR